MNEGINLGLRELGLMISNQHSVKRKKMYSHESTVCLAKVSNNSFVLSGVYLKSYQLMKWLGQRTHEIKVGL